MARTPWRTCGDNCICGEELLALGGEWGRWSASVRWGRGELVLGRDQDARDEPKPKQKKKQKKQEEELSPSLYISLSQ